MVKDNDLLIQSLVESGRVKVNLITGIVTAPKSNTPDKPLGASTQKGYLRTSIHVNGKSQAIMVHRIVCIAAHGMPLNPALHVNHKNGDKHDNRPSNLEWSTHVANMNHAKESGFYRGVGRRDGVRDCKGRFGKKAAGRLLDGRTWDEFPEVAR